MANAICNIYNLRQNNETGGVTIGLLVYFSGSDVPGGGTNSSIDVEVTGTETVAQMRTAMSAAVSQLAINVDAGFTCSGPNMLLPTFQKG